MYRLVSYIGLAVIIAFIICVLYLPLLFYFRKKGVLIARQLGCLALFCISFIIVFATMFYVPPDLTSGQHILNLQPFDWMGSAGNIREQTEVLPNILLFIPLGCFVPVVFKKMRKWPKMLLAIFLTTFSIEFIQYFIGRSSDIDDIIENMLGGIIGYLIFLLLNYLLAKNNTWQRFTGIGPKEKPPGA